MDNEDFRIRKIGGEGWLTTADLSTLSKSLGKIAALISDGEWHGQSALDAIAGTNRAAARIYELRQERRVRAWVIESRRIKGKMTAEYRMLGRKPFADKKKAHHCLTCRCVIEEGDSSEQQLTFAL